jgi:hypothetical protein
MLIGRALGAHWARIIHLGVGRPRGQRQADAELSMGDGGDAHAKLDGANRGTGAVPRSHASDCQFLAPRRADVPVP